MVARPTAAERLFLTKGLSRQASRISKLIRLPADEALVGLAKVESLPDEADGDAAAEADSEGTGEATNAPENAG